MIPREFFDWAIEQWWGPPAFLALVIIAIAGGGILLALATEKR